jgi:formamidopyrimidine-DNA glycosylase
VISVMPELPEVETVMRGLQRRLEGRTIVRAEIRRPDLRRAFPAGLAARLQGARVESFARRAKYILMRLSGGDPAQVSGGDPAQVSGGDPAQVSGGDTLLIHLGMSGRMNINRVGSNAPQPAHEHVLLETDDGWRIGFVDPRRFGSIDLMPTAAEATHPLLAGLGPEPLGPGFSTKILASALAGKRTPIKSALLDQRLVAGLGNIYVCEALFRAGIHPERLAGIISRPRITRLVGEIQATLNEAIAAGGSTLRDYVQPDGELGYFQHSFKVYGREGEKCERCLACPGILRIVQAGRSTFYCARTQR